MLERARSAPPRQRATIGRAWCRFLPILVCCAPPSYRNPPRPAEPFDGTQIAGAALTPSVARAPHGNGARARSLADQKVELHVGLGSAQARRCVGFRPYRPVSGSKRWRMQTPSTSAPAICCGPSRRRRSSAHSCSLSPTIRPTRSDVSGRPLVSSRGERQASAVVAEVAERLRTMSDEEFERVYFSAQTPPPAGILAQPWWRWPRHLRRARRADRGGQLRHSLCRGGHTAASDGSRRRRASGRPMPTGSGLHGRASVARPVPRPRYDATQRVAKWREPARQAVRLLQFRPQRRSRLLLLQAGLVQRVAGGAYRADDNPTPTAATGFRPGSRPRR